MDTKTPKTHGISVGIERSENTFFLSLKVKGTLTHLDYEKMNPILENALEGIKEPKLNVLMDAMELDGWELRAVWDDFKFGLKHKNEFEKVAICGNKNWQKISAKLGNWFVSGEVQYFEDLESGFEWLHS